MHKQFFFTHLFWQLVPRVQPGSDLFVVLIAICPWAVFDRNSRDVDFLGHFSPSKDESGEEAPPPLSSVVFVSYATALLIKYPAMLFAVASCAGIFRS